MAGVVLCHRGAVTPAERIVLTLEDLRSVAQYAARCGRESLVLFERNHPDDPRPRSALEAAEILALGGRRSNLQRTAAFAAHRAAKSAGDDVAKLAARAAGDAAGSAYLHPLAQPSQVGHILGSAANTMRAFELDAGDDPSVAVLWLDALARHATPEVRNVLARYPTAPSGAGRVSELMRELDSQLRAS